MNLFWAFFISMIAARLLHRACGQGRLRPPRNWLIVAVGFGIHVALFAGLLVLSGRPWHAGFVSVVIVAALIMGSHIKVRILAEPLAVTDAALIGQALHHPRLYYADALAKPSVWLSIAAALALLVAATMLWFALEPVRIALAGRVVSLLICAGALALLLSRRVGLGLAEHLAPERPALDVARYGLLYALVMTALARRQVRGPSALAVDAASRLPAARSAQWGPSLIIALQMESFLDPFARGMAGPDLPNIARAKAASRMHGPLMVPAEGAYTMRTEAAVLTGIPNADMGFDATDPYLTLDAYRLESLPKRLHVAGYRTLFIHPHDARFFRRDRVVPALGFEHFLAEEAFKGAPRRGPYVTDEAMAEMILRQAHSTKEPQFICAITIENHGPWAPGRLPDIDDPVSQYWHHLESADRMIGMLLDGLKHWPGGALLCAWSDHVPARTLPLDVGDRLATDYVLWDSRRRGDNPAPTVLAADQLPEVLLRAL